MKSYDDIIDLPHHVSNSHPRMLLKDRAAQFAPFSALVGYNEEIKEVSRLTQNRIEIDDELKSLLNQKLTLINNQNLEALFTYFKPDEKKSGGKYINAKGYVKRIDFINEKIILNNDIKIPINEIINIKID